MHLSLRKGFMVVRLMRFHEVEVSCQDGSVGVLWSDFPTNFPVEYGTFVVLVVSRVVVDVDDLERHLIESMVDGIIRLYTLYDDDISLLSTSTTLYKTMVHYKHKTMALGT